MNFKFDGPYDSFRCPCYMISLYTRCNDYKEVAWSKIFCPPDMIPKNQDFDYEVLDKENFEQKINERIMRAAKEHVALVKSSTGATFYMPSFGIYQMVVGCKPVRR